MTNRKPYKSDTGKKMNELLDKIDDATRLLKESWVDRHERKEKEANEKKDKEEQK